MNESNNNESHWAVRIDDVPFTLDKSDPTGLELLELIGRDPEHFFLVFRISDRPDEVVELDEPFDLTASGTEDFALVSRDRHFTIRIDETEYRVKGPFVKGVKLLELAKADPETHFVTQILVGVDDVVIGSGDRVDLTKPGVERFTIVAKPCEIIVNTRSFPAPGKEITFEEVVRLAFETSGDDANTVYTVTYSKGDPTKPVGSLVKDEHVKVRCGMEFDVDRTRRS